MSPDIIDYVDGCIKIIADFRVPAKMLLEDFIPTFSKMGIDFVATKGRDPLFVDKNWQDPRESVTTSNKRRRYFVFLIV